MSIQMNPFENFQNLKEMNITNADELRSKYEELLSMDISTKEKLLEDLGT